MQNIYFNSSEIAILINKNPFQKINNIVTKLWIKYFPDNFNQFTFKYNINTSFKDETSIINDIFKNNNINFDINDSLNSSSNSELFSKKKHIKKLIDDNFNNISNDIIPNHDKNINNYIEPIDKKLLNKNIDSLINKNFGTIHENDVLSIYLSNYPNFSATKSSLYKSKFIFNNNGYNFYIGGIIDAMRNDGTIIEIKNRVNRLFKSLKTYEKIQAMSYLFIYNSNKLHLVESFNKNIFVIDIDYDEIYMNDIIHNIKIFTDFLFLFLNSDELKFDLIDNNQSFHQKFLIFSKKN
jgi:hypothetical protein